MMRTVVAVLLTIAEVLAEHSSTVNRCSEPIDFRFHASHDTHARHARTSARVRVSTFVDRLIAHYAELCDQFSDDAWVRRLCAQGSRPSSRPPPSAHGQPWVGMAEQRAGKLRGLRRALVAYDAEGSPEIIVETLDPVTGELRDENVAINSLRASTHRGVLVAYLFEDETAAYRNGLLCMDPLELHLLKPRTCFSPIFVKQAAQASIVTRTHEHAALLSEWQLSSVRLHDWMPPLNLARGIHGARGAHPIATELEWAREQLSDGTLFGPSAHIPVALAGALASLNRSLHRASLLPNRPMLDVLRCRPAEYGQVRVQRLSHARTVFIPSNLSPTCKVRRDLACLTG